MNHIGENSREASDLVHDILRINFVLLLHDWLTVLVNVLGCHLLLEAEVLEVLANVGVELGLVTNKHQRD